ncbi:MAG TPA: iron export ABC transporter permease subunit FetB [Methanothermococcus okinawensis]|nr:iron export ABC transporter permease subunit FetB [Methanothermococcus okinawensis]
MVELIYGFIFILIAIILSIKEEIRLEKEILYSAILALIQLIILGYVLIYIFEYGGIVITYIMVLLMILTATYIVNSKMNAKIKENKRYNKRYMFLYISLTLLTVTFFTLMVLRFSHVVPYEPRYLIPLIGMIVGNSMNAIHLVLDKIVDHIRSNRSILWGYLALGASEFQALRPFMRVAITSSVTPMMNMMKSVGIIFIPGAMTGMILAGADPLYAAKIQVIIMWMVLGTALLSGLILCYLSYRELIRL